VELRLKDIKEGVDEKDLDAAFLDLPEPWDVTEIVKKAIKPGSPVIVFVPSFEQVKKTVVQMRKTGFGLVEVNEILIRGIESDEERTRPSTRMIGHTGFIISGRRLLE
jgi:tRNA (adenine57-N1/adenine58-N1)-methyltransferase